jgi:hypothetical protein
MLLLNLILLIDVTFSTPTPDFNNWVRGNKGKGNVDTSQRED